MGVERAGELTQALWLEGLELGEEQQQHRRPGIRVGLARQRQEVRNNLQFSFRLMTS